MNRNRSLLVFLGLAGGILALFCLIAVMAIGLFVVVDKGLPTATLFPVCTAPLCAPGEVFFCPGGDCPGGCGTTCATPTPGDESPVLQCTPPLCAPGEVYSCPGDCPGGCGTICVTPAPETETPVIQCTPPLCAPGEVFYCPGDCPGGCGTICVTPAP